MKKNVETLAQLSSLEEIVESPYEYCRSAEKGEQLFERVKSLIDPEDNSSSDLKRTTKQNPSKQAIEVFGAKQAQTLLDTNHDIKASGML